MSKIIMKTALSLLQNRLFGPIMDEKALWKAGDCVHDY